MGIHWTIIILEYTAHAQSKVVKDWEAWPKKKMDDFKILDSKPF